MQNMERWKMTTLIVGAVVGAAAGLAAAYLLAKRAEERNETPKLSPAEGLQIGLGLMGLMRLVSDFGDKDK